MARIETRLTATRLSRANEPPVVHEHDLVVVGAFDGVGTDAGDGLRGVAEIDLNFDFVDVALSFAGMRSAAACRWTWPLGCRPAWRAPKLDDGFLPWQVVVRIAGHRRHRRRWAPRTRR